MSGVSAEAVALMDTQRELSPFATLARTVFQSVVSLKSARLLLPRDKVVSCWKVVSSALSKNV